MILIIPTEYLNDYFKLKGKRHLGSPYVTSPEVCKKIRDAIKEFENSSLPVLLQRGYVNVVLGILCEQCGLIEFYDADVYLMKDILNYLEENYQEEVDLNSLSKKFGYSKYYRVEFFAVSHDIFGCKVGDEIIGITRLEIDIGEFYSLCRQVRKHMSLCARIFRGVKNLGLNINFRAGDIAGDEKDIIGGSRGVGTHKDTVKSNPRSSIILLLPRGIFLCQVDGGLAAYVA